MKRFLVALLILAPLWSVSAQTMRVHFINVGQGAATLFEFPCGCVLVDTGGESNGSFQSTPVLTDYLKGFFAGRTDLNNKIDVLYLTHPHIDHTRGAPAVWDAFHVANVVTNGSARRSSGSGQQNYVHVKVQETESSDEMSDDIGFEGVHLAEIPPDDGLTSTTIDPLHCPTIDPSLMVLWGTVDEKPAGWTKEAFENQNNHSVVLRVEYGDSSVLVPGDIEEAAIGGLVAKYKQSGRLDVDVVQVAHHGSKNGTTKPLMQSSRPQIAVISSGDPAREEMWTAWAYGHPNDGIVQLLADSVSLPRQAVRVPVGGGAKKFSEVVVSKAVYCTGWDGGMVLETRGDGHWKVITGQVNPAAPVNINTATEDDLVALPAIGRVRAQAIIRYRNSSGSIDSFEELSEVPGFGPATLEALQGRVVFR